MYESRIQRNLQVMTHARLRYTEDPAKFQYPEGLLSQHAQHVSSDTVSGRATQRDVSVRRGRTGDSEWLPRYDQGFSAAEAVFRNIKNFEYKKYSIY